MSKKVLVVDDEKLIVKGIRFSLEQDGMEVLDTCKDKARIDFVCLITAALTINKRRLMSCVDISKLARYEIQYSLKGCNKHSVIVGFTEKIVYLRKNFS